MVTYKILERKNPAKRTETIYYPRPIYPAKMSYEEIVQLITEKSSLSKGDVDSVMRELSSVFLSCAEAGRPFELLHLGSFYPYQAGKSVRKRDELTASLHLGSARICYYPSGKILDRVRRQRVRIEGAKASSVAGGLEEESGED